MTFHVVPILFQCVSRCSNVVSVHVSRCSNVVSVHVLAASAGHQLAAGDHVGSHHLRVPVAAAGDRLEPRPLARLPALLQLLRTLQTHEGSSHTVTRLQR